MNLKQALKAGAGWCYLHNPLSRRQQAEGVILMLHRVIPDDQLRPEADALLAKLAKGPTKAYANGKALINRRVYADLDAQLEAEADAQKEQGHSQDFIEGVLAFMQKRDANFTGQ